MLYMRMGREAEAKQILTKAFDADKPVISILASTTALSRALTRTFNCLAIDSRCCS